MTSGSAGAAFVGPAVVLAIHLSRAKGQPLDPVLECVAEAGRGLVGDHFHKRSGRHAGKLAAGTEVTLIESEALEAAEREHGVALSPAETRRNVLTRGVALNALVGHEFLVGELILRGVRLCEPCQHLSKLTGKPCLRALSGRGGLRAAIVQGGVLRVGDRIQARALSLFPESTGRQST